MAITLSLSNSQANRLAGLLSEEIFKMDAEINVLKDEILKKEEERRGIAHMISTINTNAVAAAPVTKPTAQRTAPAAKMQQAPLTPPTPKVQQQARPTTKTPAAPVKKQQTEQPAINEVPKYTLDPEDTGRDRSF